MMKEKTEEIGRLAGIFVKFAREILGENLAGVYLHGSAVMGCWNPDSSTIFLSVIPIGKVIG